MLRVLVLVVGRGVTWPMGRADDVYRHGSGLDSLVRHGSRRGAVAVKPGLVLKRSDVLALPDCARESAGRLGGFDRRGFGRGPRRVKR